MGVQLSQQDWTDLKMKGFSDDEIQSAIKEIENEDLTQSSGQAKNKTASDPRNTAQHSSFMTKEQESLVKWQLELNDILERAEHILRGDQPTFKNGQIVWDPNPSPENNPLNEKGIKRVLRSLAMYVNRNTILSDYENDEIRYKVLDFGKRTNNLIFMNAEEYGIDNEQKMNEYEMMIGEIVDIVHSAYKRALKGGERRSLREMIQISQTGAIGQGTNINLNQPQKERGLLNPARYLLGKYK